ncbi:unnamed protein product [Lepeophtheirus salmonis]|uniref:(salmon louse) hypothetical protein n=1 Tax=Lepeophtheirus salmonis TaxID=72036 RepID=A0A7R8HCD7_LEPSM|nr:unnamed protein product [Lepeophtheirus salmonis]CAF2988017.1 unnamed protein product [Lepeophtheirus salmonis]
MTIQDEKRSNICSTFSDYFLKRVNPEYMAWEDLKWSIESFIQTEKEREALSLDVIKSLENVSRFPVSRSYLRNVFTKTGLWLKEPCRLSIVGSDEDSDFDFVFKSYDSGSITLLEENEKIMGRGTTGLISWQGAGLLVEWADALGKDIIQGSNILELGSGLGLLGLTLLKNKELGIKSYTCTDTHPNVLNFLLNNAKINLENSAEKENNLESWLTSGPPVIVDTLNADYTDISIDRFRVKYLDWTNYEESELPEDIDLILGSDLKEQKALKDCGLKADVAYKRTFSPIADAVMMTHETLKPIVLYKITHEE